MTGREIAEQLVEELCARVEASVEASGEEYPLQYPTMEATSGYVSVTVAGCTVWDDEDENANPEDGETVETALTYAESVIRGIVQSLNALL